MGFFDTYQDVSGGNFVGKEEKAELANSAEAFPITRVAYNATGKFGPQFYVQITLDGEERTLGFSAESVESRDRMLNAMIDYFATNDEPVYVKLVKVNQSYILQAADE